MMPRSVVHIIESFGAGTFMILKEIVNAQADYGWKVTVFHGFREETPADYREQFSSSIELIPLKTGRSINGVYDFLDVARVARYANRNRIDILHGHSSKGGMIARAAALMSGAKAVYSPHGFSFMSPSGADTESFTFKIEKILAKLPGEIVCCSGSELSAAKLLGAQSSCIDNFIQARSIYDQTKGIAGSECNIDVISVGRISDQKNPQLFADIARELPHVRFCWVGGPLENLPPNWPANAQATGWLTHDKVLELYAQSSCYLSTSHYEGMPIVMLEAMAAGLPIVSTKVPGSCDVVRHAVTGFTGEDKDELIECLRTLLSNEPLRTSFSQKSTELALKYYDKSVALERWSIKYLELMKDEPRDSSSAV